MNEATITNQLLDYLRKVNPGPVLKHADKATIGIPDASVTGQGTTTWLEVKLVKFRKSKDFDLNTIVNKDGPQYRLMTLLGYYGSSLWVIFFTDGEGWWTYLWKGRDLSQELNLSPLFFINPGSSQPTGKSFESVWIKIQQERKR